MQSLAPVVARFGVEVCIVEPAAVGSVFVGNVDESQPECRSRRPLLRASGSLSASPAGAFANAQPPADAAAVVVQAASTSTPKFRWQTSDAAVAFAGLSLTDLDGSRVLGQTSTWLT